MNFFSVLVANDGEDTFIGEERLKFLEGGIVCESVELREHYFYWGDFLACEDPFDSEFFDCGFNEDFVEEVVGEVPLLAFGEGGKEVLRGDGGDVEVVNNSLKVEAAELLPFADGFFPATEDLVGKSGGGGAIVEGNGKGGSAGFGDPELELFGKVGAEAPV